MFDEEFAGLPATVQVALRARIEEIVRMIYNRHNSAMRDQSLRQFTKEEISGMIYGVFDLAQRLKSDIS